MNQDLLIARVAGERFAVPAIAVQSVIELGEIVPVPRSPGFVAGLTTQRSRTLTVIDVALALDLPGSSGQRGFALVADLDGVGFALAVDAVESVTPALDEAKPSTIRFAPGWTRSAVGMVETSVGAVLLVDLTKLIGIEVQQEASWQ